MLVERFSDDENGVFSFPVLQDDVLIDTIMVAKLMRLFPDWHPSPIDGVDVYGQSLERIFADARRIKDTIPLLPLDRQLCQMDIREEWKDFLRVLLALDWNKRLSASEVLQSSACQGILNLRDNLKLA